jgi:hypothetical protein
MFTGADGESHFEDVRPEEREAEHGAITLLSEAATRAVLVRLPPHFDQPWVGHPGTLAALLAGEIELTMSDGEARRFGPGAVFRVEDAGSRGHLLRVVDGDALLLLVRLPQQERA